MSELDQLFKCFEDNATPSFTTQSLDGSYTMKRKRKMDNSGNVRYKKKLEIANETGLSDVKLQPIDKKYVDSLRTNIVVTTLDSNDDCTHEVALSPNLKMPNLVPAETPFKEYPFTLDTFQKKAILCVENNQSVMVSAHTSAGKTVVAEYAIALALKKKQRVIYTTPIKALSNQKYRELLHEFKDVGLMTGDITINPMASCIIMTTEILRSMLLRGSEITKEVGWVIFDEIHYMRDKCRGVIWEETLILLSHNVHFIFLSATIPNAREFAEWICHLHSQPCHVVYTEYRPTPLEHYLFPAGGDTMHLIVDQEGTIKMDNFKKAMSILGTDDSKEEPENTEHFTKSEDVFHVVRHLMQLHLAPLIIFSFSRKDCEKYALQLANVNLNTVAEERLVDEVFNNAIDVLSEEEKQLPQITGIIPLLRRGIAFHHSGLLPLIKETVEILFGEGLIKTLFATETFAMGLNMPARTVVFTNSKKFDGTQSRYISSGEYIQMSGRAGRRGLDDKGLVVLMINEHMSDTKVENIILGRADPLNSAFHLTYNMILNLLRQEEINPEYIIQKSFLHFQTKGKIIKLSEELEKKQLKYDGIVIKKQATAETYQQIQHKLRELHERLREHIMTPYHLRNFVQNGRLVKLKNGANEYDWGILTRVVLSKRNIIVKLRTNKRIKPFSFKNLDALHVILEVDEADDNGSGLPRPPEKDQVGTVGIYPLDISMIYQISSQTVKLDENWRQSFRSIVMDLKKTYPDGLPLLHPIDDMKAGKSLEVKAIVDCINEYEVELLDHPFHQCKKRISISKNMERKQKLQAEIKELQAQLQTLQSVLQMSELSHRKVVLQKLGFCDETDVITIKGRVACELSSADELLLTEMIFSGAFTSLPVDHCVSLLSGFVCDECYDCPPPMNKQMKDSVLHLQSLALNIANIALAAKVITDKEAYIERYQTSMVEVILKWCHGATFMQVSQLTDIYEGSLIRYMRMLEEVLRQLCRAAKNIGNTDLENRFSEGIRILKRGVVFAGSLYI